MKRFSKRLFAAFSMLTLTIAAVPVAGFTMTAEAHQHHGRTYTSGCHRSYHYQNRTDHSNYHHNYSEHYHQNGICSYDVCPYASDNTTSTDNTVSFDF